MMGPQRRRVKCPGRTQERRQVARPMRAARVWELRRVHNVPCRFHLWFESTQQSSEVLLKQGAGFGGRGPDSRIAGGCDPHRSYLAEMKLELPRQRIRQ